MMLETDPALTEQRHAYVLPFTDRSVFMNIAYKFTRENAGSTYTVHDHAYQRVCVDTCTVIQEGQAQNQVLTTKSERVE